MAHDGPEALQQAERFHPDVVFLDIGMPTLDGHETAKLIRRQPWGKDMVLVALTGWGQSEDRRRSKDAGFNHHLVKPADPDGGRETAVVDSRAGCAARRAAGACVVRLDRRFTRHAMRAFLRLEQRVQLAERITRRVRHVLHRTARALDGDGHRDFHGAGLVLRRLHRPCIVDDETVLSRRAHIDSTNPDQEPRRPAGGQRARQSPSAARRDR